MCGSQLWLLTSKSVNKMYTKWRTYHRRVMSVPSTTHCDMLPLIAENMSIETRLDCKYIAFYKSIATSKNRIVNYVARNRLHEHASTMGKNMTYLMDKCDISLDDILVTSKKAMNKQCHQKWLTKVNAQYHINAHIVRELIMVKENRLSLNFTNDSYNFSYDESKFIIDYLCIN